MRKAGLTFAVPYEKIGRRENARQADKSPRQKVESQ